MSEKSHLAKTYEAVREAVSRAWPEQAQRLQVNVRYSSYPDLQLESGVSPGRGVAWFLLERSWLVEVYQEGLAVVGGAVVLSAAPATPSNTPEGCDGAWLCKLAGPYEGAEGGGWRVQFVVRYGGVLAAGHCPEAAMEECVRRFRKAFLGGSNDKKG